MDEWKSICKLEDIPRLGSRVVRSTSGDIAVFRTSTNAVFALRDDLGTPATSEPFVLRRR